MWIRFAFKTIKCERAFKQWFEIEQVHTSVNLIAALNQTMVLEGSVEFDYMNS